MAFHYKNIGVLAEPIMKTKEYRQPGIDRQLTEDDAERFILEFREGFNEQNYNELVKREHGASPRRMSPRPIHKMRIAHDNVRVRHRRVVKIADSPSDSSEDASSDSSSDVDADVMRNDDVDVAEDFDSSEEEIKKQMREFEALERNQEIQRANVPVALPNIGLPQVNNNELDNEQAELTETQKIDQFWKIINTFGWKLKSFGSPDMNAVRKLSTLPMSMQNVFAEIYEVFYIQLEAILIADDLFIRNNIQPKDHHVVVSHVIASGKETYNNLSAELEFLDNLVMMGECQSLECHLPARMHH